MERKHNWLLCLDDTLYNENNDVGVGYDNLNSSRISWGLRPFRFEKMWLSHPSFKSRCPSWWNGRVEEKWEGSIFYEVEEPYGSYEGMEYLDSWDPRKEESGDCERIRILDGLEEEGNFLRELRKERLS